LVGGESLSLPRLPPFEKDRDEGKGDYHGDNREEVCVDVGDHRPEHVTQQDDADGPEQAADQVEGDEGPVTHGPDTGNDRGKRSDDGDKSRQDDRLGPVTLEKLLGLVDVFLFEESGIGTTKQRWAHFLPEGVADLIARHGGHEAACQDHRQAQGALSCEKSRGEQEGVAGQKEPDEKSRLGKDDDEQADGAEGDQELLGIEEHWGQGIGRIEQALT
jgi:hypothetical protein